MSDPQVRPTASGSGEGGGFEGYIPTLDGWRAMAILAVMLFHATLSTFSAGGSHPSVRLLSYFSLGALGVDIFFALSGFLITSRLIQERRRHGSISLPAFYVRRFFRIFFPYFFYLVVVGGLALAGLLPVRLPEWLASLLFIRNYYPGPESAWYLGHFWSLAVEEHFYFFWPAILVLFGFARSRQVGLIICGTVGVWRAVDLHFQIFEQVFPGVAPLVRTDMRIDAILWGAIAALVIVGNPEVERWVRRHLGPLLWLVAVLAILLTIRFAVPFGGTWVALVMPILFLATAVNVRWPLSRLLETAPFRWIGHLSYSLYLWQQLFLVGPAAPRPLPLGVLQRFPLNLLALFACASVSYYFVEKPMIRKGHRITNRMRGVESHEGLAST